MGRKVLIDVNETVDAIYDRLVECGAVIGNISKQLMKQVINNVEVNTSGDWQIVCMKIEEYFGRLYSKRIFTDEYSDKTVDLSKFIQQLISQEAQKAKDEENDNE